MAIPASTIVSVTPSVLNPGGTGLTLAGMFLTSNTLLPSGPPTSFATAAAVGDYFGTDSEEYKQAVVYFRGYDGSTLKPGLLWFALYPLGATPAYIRGGVHTTLAELQAVVPAVCKPGDVTLTPTNSGGILAVGTVTGGSIYAGQTVAVDGFWPGTSSTILAQINGVPGGPGDYTVTWSSSTTVTSATVTLYDSVGVSIGVPPQVFTTNDTFLDLSSAGSFGDVADLINAAAGTSVASCAYDSAKDAFVVPSVATGADAVVSFSNPTSHGQHDLSDWLGLTRVAGAVLSQGADGFPDVPAYMDTLITYTSNWATFRTINVEPVDVTVQLLPFAQWTSAQNGRFLYVANDTDVTVVGSPAAFTGWGQQLKELNLSGTALVYDSEQTVSMICGTVASLDFSQLNGRTNFMFRTNSQITDAPLTDLTQYENMIANGYSTYCDFAVQARPEMLANGQVSGPFKWIDSYIGALYLAVDLQAALINLLQTTPSVPYNTLGYSLIAAAALDPINAALNFGTIRTNVPPSASEAAQMNAAAGKAIDGVVGTRGWYLSIQPAAATTRANRQSPPVSLFYMDGESVQQLNVASVDVL